MGRNYVAADKTFCVYLARDEAIITSTPGAAASRRTRSLKFAE
jgi:hypothetical protein